VDLVAKSALTDFRVRACIALIQASAEDPLVSALIGVVTAVLCVIVRHHCDCRASLAATTIAWIYLLICRCRYSKQSTSRLCDLCKYVLCCLCYINLNVQICQHN